jgi:hypothetical protein
VQAVHLRHFDVSDHEIWLKGATLFHEFTAILNSRNDFVAHRDELIAIVKKHASVVVGNNNSKASVHWSCRMIVS